MLLKSAFVMRDFQEIFQELYKNSLKYNKRRWWVVCF